MTSSVHDLITLAHERAAATMFLLAGDEDLREGVAAAQRLGVQVVLVGIPTARANQSLPLIREADEHVLLAPEILRTFFEPAGAPEVDAPDASSSTSASDSGEAVVRRASQLGTQFALEWLGASDSAQVGELLARHPEIPRELDVQLLLRAEEALGRSLRGEQEIRRALRAGFWTSMGGHRFNSEDTTSALEADQPTEMARQDEDP